MAKRFISFGAIEQFGSVVKTITHEAQYVGWDEEAQESSININAEMPVIVATGTEKIHGTNAAVCYSVADGFWIQSRKQIITTDNDNVGCASAVIENEGTWIAVIAQLAIAHDIDLTQSVISVYFEWGGGNIQKNSALTGLDKRAMIFQYFKVSPIEPQTSNDGTEIGAIWKETTTLTKDYVDSPGANVFNIMNFPKVEIKIDFTHPLISETTMVTMVEALEKNSLVGQAFGVDGNMGEGYVFTFEYKGSIHRFKVKGKKHLESCAKVKIPKVVDKVYEKYKMQFVTDFCCTAERLDQMFTEIVHAVHNGDVTFMTMEDTSQYLNLVRSDVIKEESDRMCEFGITPKSIYGMMDKVARMYFRHRIENRFLWQK